MTRDAFVQKAVSAGLNDSDIKSAMDDRRKSIGAFDDEKAPSVNSANKSIGTKIEETLFPTAMKKIEDSGAGLGSNLSTLSDIMHWPARALDVASEGVGKGMDVVKNKLTGSTGETFAGGREGGIKAVSNISPLAGQAAEMVTDPMTINPFLKVAPEGAEALQAGLKLGEKAVSEIAPRTIGTEGLTANQIATNSAAKRIGLTLSKAQEEAPIGVAPKSGTSSTIDKVLTKLPTTSGIYNSAKQGNEAAMQKAISDLSEGATPEAYNSAKSALTGRIEDLGEGIKNNFETLKTEGKKAYIDGLEASDTARKKIINSGMRIFDKNGEKLNGVTSIPEDAVQRIDENLNQLKNISNDISIDPATKAGENYTAFTTLRQNIGGEIQRLKDQLSNPMQSVNKSQVASELKANNIIYSQIKDLEYNHLKTYSGNNVADLWKTTNELFSEDKPVTDLVKKILGFGKNAGDKGFKESEDAINNLTNPKNAELINRFLPLVDDDQKQLLGSALIRKMLDHSVSTIAGENGEQIANAISIPKLQNQYMALTRTDAGKNLASQLLGQDKIQKINDILAGAQRVGYKQISLADESNPSGTAQGVATITGLLGEGVLSVTKALAAIKAGVGAIALTPLTRMLARWSLNLPKTATDRLIASPLGGLGASSFKNISPIVGSTLGDQRMGEVK